MAQRCVMDFHAKTWTMIPGEDSVKTELHVLCKGQCIGVPSLNDLAVDDMLNTTNRLVGCVLLPIDSDVILRWHPHLLYLAEDVKLSFYTVPAVN